MLSLRPYQQAAVSAIYQYFASNDGHPLIVIPTAGGKSIVLASFIQGVLQRWPDQRILVVTHVRELIAQNHAEMMGLWPEAMSGRTFNARGNTSSCKSADKRLIRNEKSNSSHSSIVQGGYGGE